jgi:hypothetical protein
MQEAVSEFVSTETPGKAKRRRNVWLWALIWLTGFLVLPGFLAGLIYQQKARDSTESLPKVSEVRTAIAPAWVPLGGDSRLEQSYMGESSGNATLYVRKPVDAVLEVYDAQLRQAGFQVSRKLVERDQAVSGAILNASHSGLGRFLLITLNTAGEATRVELSFSESR